jgi:hypothetical protein
LCSTLLFLAAYQSDDESRLWLDVFEWLLHYKDLLPVWEERRRAIRSSRPSHAFRIGRLMRPVLFVPETKPASQMFDEFRTGRSHLAIVVDEFGTIIGMLTVEDVLEQIVGRIEDEHDEKVERRGAETDDVELDGTARIRDLDSEYGIEIPPDAGFETLAGFLLFRLGDIPQAGASVEYQGRRFTVLEMDRNRIARVRIEKLGQPGCIHHHRVGEIPAATAADPHHAPRGTAGVGKGTRFRRPAGESIAGGGRTRLRQPVARGNAGRSTAAVGAAAQRMA